MKEKLIQIPARLLDLISKLISVKGVFAIVITIFCFMGMLDPLYAFVAWTVMVGVRSVTAGIKQVAEAKALLKKE